MIDDMLYPSTHQYLCYFVSCTLLEVKVVVDGNVVATTDWRENHLKFEFTPSFLVNAVWRLGEGCRRAWSICFFCHHQKLSAAWCLLTTGRVLEGRMQLVRDLLKDLGRDVFSIASSQANLDVPFSHWVPFYGLPILPAEKSR
jgi:hypothetical protein